MISNEPFLESLQATVENRSFGFGGAIPAPIKRSQHSSPRPHFASSHLSGGIKARVFLDPVESPVEVEIMTTQTCIPHFQQLHFKVSDGIVANVMYHEVVTLPSIIDFENPMQTTLHKVVYQRLHKRLHCSSFGEHGDPALQRANCFWKLLELLELLELLGLIKQQTRVTR
jgi:hypothetical protein